MSELSKKEAKPSFLDYVIVYLAFAFSATSYFFADKYKLTGFIVIVAILFFRGRFTDRFNNNMKLFLVYFVFIYLSQSMLFEKTNNLAFIFILGRSVLLPFFLLSITRRTFIPAYINIIIFFSIVSLIFWALSNLYPNFYEFTSTIPVKYGTDLLPDNNKMFIIYTYESVSVYGIIRNPGPTWEPGGWAVFLTLALILNMMRGKKLFTIANILIIANIITTFSTTGYLGLAIIFLHFLMFSKTTNAIIKILSVPIFLYWFFIFYNSSEFMSQKIQTSIEDAKNRNITETRSGRFFTLRKAAVTFARYPVSGRGLIAATYAEEGEEEGSGYGIIDLGSRFGIPALILYLIILFRSIKLLNRISGVQNKLFAITAFIVLLLHLLSQTVYITPILLMIFFIYPSSLVPLINTKVQRQFV
jgi:uncharacterized membrane protein